MKREQSQVSLSAENAGTCLTRAAIFHKINHGAISSALPRRAKSLETLASGGGVTANGQGRRQKKPDETLSYVMSSV